jgi:hypothetical protein
MTYLGGLKIDKNMVVVMNRVSICIRLATPPLKVFPTDETAIDIDI